MKLFTRKEVEASEDTRLDLVRAQSSKAAKSLEEKIKELNKLREETSLKLIERQKVLSEIEFKIKNQLAGYERAVIVLEDRKREALKPITDELWCLEKEKAEVKNLVLLLRDNEKALEQREAALQLKKGDIEIQERKVEALKTETSTYFDRERKSLQNLIEESNIAVARMRQEAERVQALQEGAEVREESLRRAENKAKGAIALADQKILEEKREQKKTDEKRKMLAIAIATLKKKGLWHKQIATGIK